MSKSERNFTVVSETRFAHFIRAAAPAERQRVLVKAMKVATDEQKRVMHLHKEKQAAASAIAA